MSELKTYVFNTEEIIEEKPKNKELKKYIINQQGIAVDALGNPVEFEGVKTSKGVKELTLLTELAYLGASELKGKDSIKMMKYIDELETRVKNKDISDLTISEDMIKRFKDAYYLVKKIPREWIMYCKGLIFFIVGE